MQYCTHRHIHDKQHKHASNENTRYMGYGDEGFRGSAGIGILWGFPEVFLRVWDGCGDWNPTPTAALSSWHCLDEVRSVRSSASSQVKVQGHEEKVAKVVGATSSEDFLVSCDVCFDVNVDGKLLSINPVIGFPSGGASVKSQCCCCLTSLSTVQSHLLADITGSSFVNKVEDTEDSKPKDGRRWK